MSQHDAKLSRTIMGFSFATVAKIMCIQYFLLTQMSNGLYSSAYLSVAVHVIAWRTVSEMTCNVSSGTLNLTHSLTHYH